MVVVFRLKTQFFVCPHFKSQIIEMNSKARAHQSGFFYFLTIGQADFLLFTPLEISIGEILF